MICLFFTQKKNKQMDVTPCQDTETEDSGCLTGSFENSKIPFESTPNATPTTSLEVSRKRKAFLLAPPLTNIPETCPTPQFSSTLNESLLNLDKCTITPNYYVERSELNFDAKPSKYAKFNDNKPVTPVKEKVQSTYYESPYKEACDILYPAKPVVSGRKTLTPQKVNGVKRIFSPAKKRLFGPTRVDPMLYFVGKSPILEKIFENVSNGDLFRISMVSKTWNEALMSDAKASVRYRDFIEKHRVNKENYSVTPPDSPSSPDSPPVSPGRLQFHAYTKIAKTLTHTQSLTKCPACYRPSIMEKNIGQCQNPHCGYIYCSICLSFSTNGPEEFHDKCENSKLLVNKTHRPSSRFSLSDLSNSGFDLEHSTFFTETSQSSGYVSEMESPLRKVKRNLIGRFSTERTGILSENNRNVSVKVHHKKRRASLVPVISNEVKENTEIAEPASPPKVKVVVCSKQSKKNLKRLLR